MDKAVKIIVSIFLFLCLLDMPYGFYQLFRFVAMVSFSLLALEANEKGRKIEVIIYIGLALLFQPFFKIALGRLIWNVVDVVVGVGLILIVVLQKNKKFSK